MARNVTFIGLGNMGAALIRAHLKAGSNVTVWNRNLDKPIVSDLKKEGARVEGDFCTAIAASQFLVVALPEYASVYDCCNDISSEQLARAFSGLKAMINLTSGSPGDAREMQRWSQQHECSLHIDGGIMAGPDNIGDNETAFILYSGDIPDSLAGGVRELISVFGRPEYVGKSTGNARTYDNAVLAATYGMFNGLMLSTAILSKAGKQSYGSSSEKPNSTGRMSEPIQRYVTPLLRAAVEENESFAKSLEQNNDDSQGSAVSMLASSLRNLLRSCEELGVDGSGLEHFWKLCDQVTQDGNGRGGMTLVAKRLMQQD